MILNAARIADMLREGQDSDTPDPLVITPTASIQEIERSGSASVDLRLGTWLAEMRHARITHLEPAKPEPEQDEKTHEVELTKLHYVRYGSRYLLHPGNFVLGATLEWIRVPPVWRGTSSASPVGADAASLSLRQRGSILVSRVVLPWS